ncbi:MAG: WD domain, G-beta repeat [Candidatus Dependentiae bacterium ADurb.Bin331]|nr:MAG: WD domain, G-beta repeat [Candidatus Dependentiae bacterium ADurb.Bin331]
MNKFLLFLILCMCVSFSHAEITFQLSDGEITLNNEEFSHLRKKSVTINNLFSDTEQENGDSPLILPNISVQTFNELKAHLSDLPVDIEKQFSSLTLDQAIHFLSAIDFLDIQELMEQSEKMLAIRLTEPALLKRFITEPTLLSTLQLPNTLSFSIAQRIIQLPTTSLKKIIKNIIQIPIKKLCTTDDIVKSLCLTNNGILFSGGARGTIKMWNSKTGKYLHTVQHHGFAVHTLITNKENTSLYSGSNDMITVWDIEQRKLVHVIAADELITFALRNDGTIFGSTHHQNLHGWNNEGKELPLKFPKLSKIMALCFNNDGNILFAGYNDGSIIAWDSNDGTQLYKITPYTQPITALQFHEGILVSSSSDGKIILFDSTSRKIINTLDIDENILNFCFLHKNLICALDEKRKMSIWDCVTGKNYFSLKNELQLTSLITQPQNFVLAGSRDSSIYQYDFNPLNTLIATLSHDLNFSQLLLFITPEQIDLNTMPQFIEPFHTLEQALQQSLIKIKKVVPVSTLTKTYQYLKSLFHQ